MDKLIRIFIDLYPHYKNVEKEKKLLHQILHRKFSGLDDEIITMHGHSFQERSHTKWTWKETFYDHLEDESKLPLAVSIPPKLEQQFSISHARSEGTPYVRFSPKRKSAEEKAKEEAFYDDLEHEYEQLSFSKLANIYIAHKIEWDMVNQQYQRIRQQFWDKMNDEKISLCQTPLGSIRLVNGKPTYCLETLVKEEIEKKFCFLLQKQGSHHQCWDLFSNHVFPFDTETMYQNHQLSFNGNTFRVDGKPMHDHQLIAPLKQKEVELIHQQVLAGDAMLFSGSTRIDAMHFFRHCPISSSNIESLIDQGLLTPRTVEQFRFCASEEDLSTRFEVIDEESTQRRRALLQERHDRRAEVFRLRKESEQTLS